MTPTCTMPEPTDYDHVNTHESGDMYSPSSAHNIMNSDSASTSECEQRDGEFDLNSALHLLSDRLNELDSSIREDLRDLQTNTSSLEDICHT